jgi:hypothetical protein
MIVLDLWKELHAQNNLDKALIRYDELQDQLLVQEVIPNLINDNVNTLLTLIPSQEKIKKINVNKDGAPGPDGYGAIFYQKYWGIIQENVVNAVLQYFISGWIMSSFNSNTIILIHKTNNADSPQENFKLLAAKSTINISCYTLIAFRNSFKFQYYTYDSI